MVSFEAPEYCELHAAFWLFLYFDLQIVTSGTKYSTPSKKKIEHKKLFRKANKITQTFNWIILWHLYAYDVHRRHSKKSRFFSTVFQWYILEWTKRFIYILDIFSSWKMFWAQFFHFPIEVCLCNMYMQQKYADNGIKKTKKTGEE